MGGWIYISCESVETLNWRCIWPHLWAVPGHLLQSVWNWSNPGSEWLLSHLEMTASMPCLMELVFSCTWTGHSSATNRGDHLNFSEVFIWSLVPQRRQPLISSRGGAFDSRYSPPHVWSHLPSLDVIPQKYVSFQTGFVSSVLTQFIMIIKCLSA